MKTRVQKWGNSLALRIPRAVAEESHLCQGSTVEIHAVDGRLVIEPQRPPQYKLDELLAQVTKQNTHKEVSTGGPVGKEVM